jgi:hypothetical protein
MHVGGRRAPTKLDSGWASRCKNAPRTRDQFSSHHQVIPAPLYAFFIGTNPPCHMVLCVLGARLSSWLLEINELLTRYFIDLHVYLLLGIRGCSWQRGSKEVDFLRRMNAMHFTRLHPEGITRIQTRNAKIRSTDENIVMLNGSGQAYCEMPIYYVDFALRSFR